ncbi:hypothetical protein [Streptomyces sp. NPDC048191]|uniref:hypothetical protein n=1 Tax=Streptomyces sp. NPDC048191 TaxID=3155484 RepID=UPI0033F8E20C
MGVREALAEILTTPAIVLAQWREHPQSLRDRHQLSQAEADMLLTAATHAGCQVTADQVRFKLRTALECALPRTVAEADARHGPVVEEFVRNTVRRPFLDKETALFALGDTFLAWIAGQVPDGLIDFGQFELVRNRLVHDPVAAEAARTWAHTDHGTSPAAGREQVARSRLTLSATVRLAAYDHDVTAVQAPRNLPRQPVHVMLHRRWKQPPRIYRAGMGTTLLLSLCDGTRTGSDIAGISGIEAGAAMDTLQRLAKAGVVTPNLPIPNPASPGATSTGGNTHPG